MEENGLSAGWFGFRGTHGRSVVELIALGTLDSELAGLLWLLLEARLPVVVAAEPWQAGKSTLLSALLDFLPPRTRRVELRGSNEDFDWLPEAAELGWRDAGGGESPGRPSPAASVSPEATYLLAAELSNHLPIYTWGDQARIAIRALSLGYGLGATIHADSLEEVFEILGGPPVGLSGDELSRIGVVLILRVSPSRARRVVAAHYVRPVVRDAQGHVQRLGPAVLATWDPGSGTFEHFAWGVLPELAERVGRKAGAFNAESTKRAEFLRGLLAGGVTGVPEVRAAIQGYRLWEDSQLRN